VTAVGVALLAAGCGSSSDSPSTTEATLPTVTAPTISTHGSTAPVQQRDATATTSTTTPAKGGTKTAGSGGSSDQAKANGGGGSSGKSVITGPSDAAKAKNPGAYGGSGSSATGQSDKQKAGG
jgi:hypothetical protein